MTSHEALTIGAALPVAGAVHEIAQRAAAETPGRLRRRRPCARMMYPVPLAPAAASSM